jgi:hypothetical protein
MPEFKIHDGEKIFKIPHIELFWHGFTDTGFSLAKSGFPGSYPA